jgi:hypothetical protein
MTPEEMKAASFDKIARIVKGIKGDHMCLAAISRVDDVISKLERDVKRFWRRMAQFDKDIMTGKNRMCQMTRTVFPFGERTDGTKCTFEDSYTEAWDPDTKMWGREK